MYQNITYICISSYSKICWFSVKNADVSRTQGFYHVIYISIYIYICIYIYIYLCSLGKVQVFQVKFHSCMICLTDFREAEFFCASPIHEQPRKDPSWIELNLKNGLRKSHINDIIIKHKEWIKKDFHTL